MKRATIIAKGDVQRVGYRYAVEKIARRLNITGFVENLKPYDVKIVAEGEEDILDEFITRIRINKFTISVEDLDVEFGAATGEFEYFEIRRGDWEEELGERMDAVLALLHTYVQLQEKSVETREAMYEKWDARTSRTWAENARETRYDNTSIEKCEGRYKSDKRRYKSDKGHKREYWDNEK